MKMKLNQLKFLVLPDRMASTLIPQLYRVAVIHYMKRTVCEITGQPGQLDSRNMVYIHRRLIDPFPAHQVLFVIFFQFAPMFRPGSTFIPPRLRNFFIG